MFIFTNYLLILSKILILRHTQLVKRLYVFMVKTSKNTKN